LVAALCVAGVALGDIYLRFAWQAWHRRGTWRHPPPFHVAGVAFGDIYLRFAWQAWHFWHWAGSGGALGLGLVAGDRATLRCRRGTWRHPASFHVAGVALGNIHLRFGCFVLPSWTHHLSHTTLSQTIFATHHFSNTTFHTPFFTPNFVTHHLLDTPSFTHHFVTHHL